MIWLGTHIILFCLIFSYLSKFIYLFNIHFFQVALCLWKVGWSVMQKKEWLIKVV